MMTKQKTKLIYLNVIRHGWVFTHLIENSITKSVHNKAIHFEKQHTDILEKVKLKLS